MATFLIVNEETGENVGQADSERLIRALAHTSAAYRQGTPSEPEETAQEPTEAPEPTSRKRLPIPASWIVFAVVVGGTALTIFALVLGQSADIKNHTPVKAPTEQKEVCRKYDSLDDQLKCFQKISEPR